MEYAVQFKGIEVGAHGMRSGSRPMVDGSYRFRGLRFSSEAPTWSGILRRTTITRKDVHTITVRA